MGSGGLDRTAMRRGRPASAASSATRREAATISSHAWAGSSPDPRKRRQARSETVNPAGTGIPSRARSRIIRPRTPSWSTTSPGLSANGQTNRIAQG